MYSTAICGLSGSTIFMTPSHKRHDFPKKKKNIYIYIYEHKMCLDFLHIFFSETFLILGRIQRDVTINPLAPELFFFFNFSTLCIGNVNNTGTKQVSIMKQTAF